ncbi:dsDNA nuclease domain-containing protein [Bacillus cereus]|uniref:dsDNA nuclease domain-containing protein n=1 Tax=Bacillus cereus TaxID=1396 RepID=UPI003D1665B9
MNLHTQKQSNIESYIRKKIELFHDSQNEELKFKEEEIELLVSSLISGDIKDLGGLIALRGFVYQYYVAISYMVDMLHPSGAWWDAVIFELLDDIVLLNETCIRFVQVKTGREDGRHKLKPSNLYDRKSQLNSWLDKLFLNIHTYQLKQKDSAYNINIDENFKVEFEIATNYPEEYDNYLEPYFTNNSYNLPTEERHEKDILPKKLESPLHIFENKDGKKIKIDTQYLENQLTPFNIDWCLQRLYINHLGWFANLEKAVKGKIQDVINEKKSTFSSAIAEYIMDRLLATVVARTHDDSPHLNKRDLIFTREELSTMFDTWKKEAVVQLYEYSKQNSLIGKFDSCVEELQESIKRNWEGETQKALLDRLDWIYLHLLERFKNDSDSHVYEKFLNRLFNMKNVNAPIHLHRTSEKQHLINSLKYMAIYLSFYTEHEFPYLGSSLLFNQGMYGDEEAKTFVTFNAQQEIEFDTAQRRILQIAQKCPETKRIQNDYYCIVIDAKENIDSSDPVGALFGITANSNEKKITDIPPNIRFIDPKQFKTLMHSLEKNSKQVDFQNEALFNMWNQTIEQPTMGDDTK